ncbi:MAG: protein-glutamate O-methyltransferase CheR [Caulobacterales bacterium]
MSGKTMFTDTEFSLIAREVKTRTGYALTPSLAPTMESRLMALQRRENYANVNELVAAARANHRLWDLIADALAHPETRFFRDRAFFHSLRTEILPNLARNATAGQRIRIWSAGCSTGQEAYSLAILSDELRATGALIEIVATDHSDRLLDKARSGLFSQFEVQRGLPIRTLIEHFEKASDLWRISDRLRAQVRFERHNLLSSADKLGQFDLVLCCNVLNDMDPAPRQLALENIAAALTGQGLLATGEDGVTAVAPHALTPSGQIKGIYQRNAGWRRAA